MSTHIILKTLPNIVASIDLHVLKNNSAAVDMIIGRDFLSQHGISVSLKLKEDEAKTRIELFSEIVLAEVVNDTADNLKDSLSELEIDCNPSVKQDLVSLFQEVENAPIEPVLEDYSVKIALKDYSVYAYGPRRFAWSERIKMREITDDLLARVPVLR